MFKLDKINYLGALGVSVLSAVLFCVGCSPIQGERYWWDDQTSEQLANDYMLPDSPPEYPVPTDPPPFVPKNLEENEIELATQQEKEQIALGIPRSGVPDPLENRVVVPAEKYVSPDDYGNEEDAEIDYAEEGLDDEGFDAAQAADEENFALEEEKVDGSSEARDFMDEMNSEENYTTKGEQNVGGSGETRLDQFIDEGFSDNPGPEAEEATDAKLNNLNILEDDPFILDGDPLAVP